MLTGTHYQYQVYKNTELINISLIFLNLTPIRKRQIAQLAFFKRIKIEKIQINSLLLLTFLYLAMDNICDIVKHENT